ncbi:MAG: diguanylate cyclase [Cyanobacteria bacterium J06626_6]
MLKRPFHTSSATASWLLAASDSREVTPGTIQPPAEKGFAQESSQGLAHLTDQESKVCVSGGSGCDASENNQLTGSLSERPWHDPVAFQASCLRAESEAIAPDSAANDDLTAEIRQLEQLRQYVFQQTQLRRVERQLRRTLSASAIFGTVVVEAAKLFSAKHVSLLRYQPKAQSFQQVTRYCQNEALAWLPPVEFSLTEFPMLTQQLRQGKALRIPLEPPTASLPAPLLSPPPSSLQKGGCEDKARPDSPDAYPPAFTLDELAVNSLSTVGWVEHSVLDQTRREKGLLEQDINPLQKETLGKAALDGASLNEESQQWLALRPGSWLIVPIRNREREADRDIQACWGVLALALPDRNVWTKGAIAAAQSIAVEMTLAIAQSQQYQELLTANQELQKLALSDGLTSLANRRRFDEHLADEWQRLARDQQPLSLILCDLDHFKRYNDTFGHPAGDRCLIRVARALLNGPQRPADLVARYGGEEFAIILPNTDTHGAWRIAQKIHESIRALQIAHAADNEEPYVTVTMGVSTVVPGHEMTAQMLVQASDLALYHAKQHGRNRTYVNGHYNTVQFDQLPGDHRAKADQPDVMPIAE